jgi:tRNA threonylcarbamoyladenosine biosynthesis protein TsaB
VNVLGLDTATLTASVALVSDGVLVVERRRKVTTHSEMLLSLVDEVLAEAALTPAALDGIACGAGPGSFTGLRIGLATAKGLCFALGRPLALVSSLAALAARAPDGSRVVAVLDAFKGEVYAGRFTVADGVPIGDGDEQVLAPAALAAQLAVVDGPLALVGEGALRYRAQLPPLALVDEEPAPRAADVARLGALRLARGDADDLARSSPRYVRPSEAELAKKKSSTK